MTRCFACDRPTQHPINAETTDGQIVLVGSKCAKLIEQAGANGYQPPTGGPRIIATWNATDANRR